MVFTRVHWSPIHSTSVFQWQKSIWTPHGLSSPVNSSGLQSTPVMTDISRLGCGESPLESSGVHMEYGGDRQELLAATKLKIFPKSNYQKFT